MAVTPADTFIDNSAQINQLNDQLKKSGQIPDSAADSAKGAADLNFNNFLTMLSVQLQNQDPLNPMDGTAFTEQLATFSQLEQQITSNSHLEKLAEANDFSQQALAVSYIGKDALIKGDITATDGESDILLNYTLDAGAANTLIELVNEDGTKVATLEGTNYVGRNELVWDSKGDDGNAVEPGLYKMYVSSLDAEGNPVESKTFTYGRVVAVEGDSDDLKLTTADGRATRFEDILMVKQNVAVAAPAEDESDS